MGKRRQVTDEEFRQALKNKDVIRVMHRVMNKYKNLIPSDDLYNCGLHGLWRCLGYYIPGKGCKLTTYLWTFVKRECCRELKRMFRQLAKNTINFSTIDSEDSFEIKDQKEEKAEKLRQLQDCVSVLPKASQQLINEYYFERCTMEEIGKKHGYSKEAARQKINRATDQLRKVCLAGV